MTGSSYWYLGLSLLSLTLLIYICVKKNAVRSLLLFLILVQIAYLIETVIYIFLGSYEYHPGLIKHSSFYDSNIGALCSNMLVIPVLAALIAVYRLNWLWKIMFIGFLAGVEWIFIKLHIFTPYWWRIEYTSIGLVVYFSIANVIYSLIMRPVKGWLHFLFLFLSTAPLAGTFHIIPIMLFLNRYYMPGWFTDKFRDTTAFSSLYYLFGTFVVVITVKLPWKLSWIKYLLLAAFFYIVTVTLTAVTILDSRVWWDPWYYVLFPLVLYEFSSELSKLLSNGPSYENQK